MSRRQQRRVHMMMWAMLTHQIDPVASWAYLFEWARLLQKEGPTT